MVLNENKFYKFLSILKMISTEEADTGKGSTTKNKEKFLYLLRRHLIDDVILLNAVIFP